MKLAQAVRMYAGQMVGDDLLLFALQDCPITDPFRTSVTDNWISGPLARAEAMDALFEAAAWFGAAESSFADMRRTFKYGKETLWHVDQRMRPRPHLWLGRCQPVTNCEELSSGYIRHIDDQYSRRVSIGLMVEYANAVEHTITAMHRCLQRL